MSRTTKNISLIGTIGIISIIIGYSFIFYRGYNLDKEILTKRNQAKLLGTQIFKLKIDSIGLSKNNSQLKEKIKETDSTIASVSNKSNSVERLRKELGIPSDKYFTQTSPKSISIENAKLYESDGFKYLLNKNIDSAITSFTRSEKSYNGYHQMYELSKFLTKNKTQSNFDWNLIYRKILSDYSWGMPEKYKTELQKTPNKAAHNMGVCCKCGWALLASATVRYCASVQA